MIRLALIISHLLIVIWHLNAQVTFRKIIGGTGNDVGYSVLQNTDSGYVIAGGTYMAGSNDFYLVQTDKYGDTVLVKRYGGGGSDIAYDVINVAGSTDYLVLGTTSSFGAGGGDAYLIRVNNLGDTVWTKTYGGSSNEWVWDIDETLDGGYIFAGQTTSYGAGLNDVYVIKIDATGDTLWTRTYGNSDGNAARTIHSVSTGGYVIGAGGILRIDNAGNLQWGEKGQGGYVVPVEDEGYLVGSGIISGGSGAVILIKTDSTAASIWSKSYAIQGCNLTINSLAKTLDDGYVIAGDLCATSNLGEAFLMRIDSMGTVLWANIYKEWEQIIPSEITKTTFYDVKSTSDGGFIAVGEASSFFTRDVYMVKTDANGNTGCGNDSVFFPITNSVTLLDSNVNVQVGTGAIVGSTSTSVMVTSTIENVLCFDTITGIDIRNVGLGEKTNLLIFPNPFSDFATIEAVVLDEIATGRLRIVDLLGVTHKVIVLSAGYNDVTLLKGDLPASGIYFCILEVNDQVLEKTKFISLR